MNSTLDGNLFLICFCKFWKGTPPSGGSQLAARAHAPFAASVASGEVLTHPPASTERDGGIVLLALPIEKSVPMEILFLCRNLRYVLDVLVQLMGLHSNLNLNLTQRLKLSLLLDYSFKPWLTRNKSSFVLHVIADTRNMSTLERLKWRSSFEQVNHVTRRITQSVKELSRTRCCAAHLLRRCWKRAALAACCWACSRLGTKNSMLWLGNQSEAFP